MKRVKIIVNQSIMYNKKHYTPDDGYFEVEDKDLKQIRNLVEVEGEKKPKKSDKKK